MSVSPRVHLKVVGLLRFISGDMNQPSLPTPFILFLVSASVSMAPSITFRSRNLRLRVISSDMDQPSLPTPFIVFLVSASVCVALSTIFRSRNLGLQVISGDTDQPSSPTPFILFLVSVSVSMAFQLYFVPKILQTTPHFLITLFRSSFWITGPFNYIFSSLKSP